MKTAIIIGAGVSGLQAARALLKRGIRPVLLEQGSKPGGVWRNAPPESELQVPYSCWAFAEHPWPRDAVDGEHPSAKAVQEYVWSYAERYDLLPNIMFGCKVKRVTLTGTGGYMVTFIHSQNGSMDLGVMVSDYLVVCIGHNSSPYVPAYRDSSCFIGRHLHAAALSSPAVIEGKRVVVVGAGRTAQECAALAALPGRAATVTCVFRQMYWPTPRVMRTGTSLEQLLLSRAPLQLLPPYYTASGYQKLLWRLVGPLRASYWGRLEKQLTQQFGLGAAGRTMMPPTALQADLLHSSQALGATWHALIDSAAMYRVLNKRQQRQQRRGSGLLQGWWASPKPSSQQTSVHGVSAAARLSAHLGRQSMSSITAAGNAQQLSVLGGLIGSRRSSQASHAPGTRNLSMAGGTKTRRGSLLMIETRGSLGGSHQQQALESADDSSAINRYPRAAAAAALAATARSRASFDSSSAPASPRRKPPTRQGSYRPDSPSNGYQDLWEGRGTGVLAEVTSAPSTPRGPARSLSRRWGSNSPDRVVSGDSRSRHALMVERSCVSFPADKGAEQLALPLTSPRGRTKHSEEIPGRLEQQPSTKGARRSMNESVVAASGMAAAPAYAAAMQEGVRHDQMDGEGDGALSIPILLQLPRNLAGTGKYHAGQAAGPASGYESGQPSPRLRGSLEQPLSLTTAGTHARSSSTSSRQASLVMNDRSGGINSLGSVRGSISGSVVMQSLARGYSDLSVDRSLTPSSSTVQDGKHGLLSRLRRKLSSAGDLQEDEEDEPARQPQLLLPGGIHPIRGDVARFTPKGVVLTNGQQLPADVVLYCTGYAKQYNWLDGAITDLLGAQKDGLHLYRSILSPRLTTLAFVGSEVATYNSILTAGLQAEWVAAVWAGQVALPSTAAMQKDVRRQMRWRRKHIPVHRGRAASVQLYMAEYHDQLMADMELAAMGRGLGQRTMPLTPEHYRSAFEQHKAAEQSAVRQRLSVQLQQQDNGTSESLYQPQLQHEEGDQQLPTPSAAAALVSPQQGSQTPTSAARITQQSRSVDNASAAAPAPPAAVYHLAMHSQLYEVTKAGSSHAMQDGSSQERAGIKAGMGEHSSSTASAVGAAAGGRPLPMHALGLENQASGKQYGVQAAGTCWIGVAPSDSLQQPAQKQDAAGMLRQHSYGNEGPGALTAPEDSLVQARQRVEWWLRHHDADA